MTIALIDCVGGASGNMLLGALIDAGLDPRQLTEGLARLPVEPWSLEVERVKRRGIAATHVEVRTSEARAHRHLRDVMALLDEAGLPEPARQKAGRVFQRLAEAEGHVHGVGPERVHFHEVGAVDAIVDITGTALGLHLLGVERLHLQGPLPAGKGTITCEHGTLPNPPPATVELCRGHEVRFVDVEAELVTPTGAALLTTLSSPGPFEGELRIDASGHGAGTRDLRIPNVLRLVLGSASAPARPETRRERVVVLEANVDDMNPQVYEFVAERLFEAGALDTWLTPVHMKKGRPAVVLAVLGWPQDEKSLASIVLEETTTLGVRIRETERLALPREIVTVSTPLGPVACKRASLEGLPPRVQPEYEDCRRLARENGLPLLAVLEMARIAAAALGLDEEMG